MSVLIPEKPVVVETQQDLKPLEREPSPQVAMTRTLFVNRLWRSLLAFIMVLVAAEGLARVVVILAKPPLSYSKEFDAKYALAEAQTEKPTLIFLGNSKIDRAVYTELLAMRLKEKGLDYTIKNLAVNSATPEMSLALLKTALKAGEPPKLVVYNLEPLYLNRAFYHTTLPGVARQNFEQSFYGRCQFKTPQTFQEQSNCFLEKTSSLFRYRSFLSTTLGDVQKHFYSPKRALRPNTTRTRVTTEVSSGGWTAAYPVLTQTDITETFQRQKQQTEKNFRKVRHFELDTKPVEALLEYCHQRHIPLVLVWMPEYDRLIAYRNENGPLSQKDFEAYFGKLVSGRGHFLNFVNRDKDPSHYYHPTHLNVLGAIQFTEALADKLLSPPYLPLLKTTEQRGGAA